MSKKNLTPDFATGREDEAPLLATPVQLCDILPRWFRGCLPERIRDQLPAHPSVYDLARCQTIETARLVFDHCGETIIDGRRALVSEPYARGCVRSFAEAADLADATRLELRMTRQTWHGYGTMRFAWLAPRDIAPTKQLVQYVRIYGIAAAEIRELVADLDAPPLDRQWLIDDFWHPLWSRLVCFLPGISGRDAEEVRQAAEALLVWHGYQVKWERAAS